MYEDLNYWMHCAHRFRGILDGFGINARSLYWCPNNLQEAEREEREAAERAEAAKAWEPEPAPAPEATGKAEVEAAAWPLRGCEVTNFSHSNLYELEVSRGP